jgi:hypothetical protein
MGKVKEILIAVLIGAAGTVAGLYAWNKYTEYKLKQQVKAVTGAATVEG